MKNISGIAAKKRGFTVIELLVVIAIIGILAGITLGSLSMARKKGNDASTKADMNSIRTGAAEQFYLSNNGSYGTSSGTAGSCSDTLGSLGATNGNGSTMWGDTASNMKTIIASLWAITGSSASNMDCGTSATAWSVAVQLQTGGYWCVDSLGRVSGISTSTAVAYSSLNAAGTAGAHNGAGATACN